MESKNEKDLENKNISGTGAIFDFLYTEAEKPKEIEVSISNRIPYKFKIRPLTLDEHREFQKKATKMKLTGKKREIDFNAMLYNIESCIACTIEPNFRDTNNIKKAGCATPDMLLSKLLLPGEIMELASQISELSGFSEDINEDIEEAKN